MVETRKKAQIVGASMLSPSVRSLRIAPADGPLSFVAGQWVNVFMPTAAGTQKRAYSIASAPGDTAFELAITLVKDGELSPLLHALEVGQVLEMDGPHGFFTRTEEQRALPALYVATGTGLSPLRSMLLADAKLSQRAPTTLLFGCRSRADILWGDELRALARERPELRVEVTLSRADAAWPGCRGYVQAHVAELSRALGEPHVYICGLNHMVSEVRALCKGGLGYDRKRIHSERYD
jgi:CDP-4-dehydro-6-deoxyglucose reductase, E3